MKYNENYKVFDTAAKLPDEWDEIIGDNIYMRRYFLLFLEKSIPCGQKYYIFYNSNNYPDTIFATYRNKAFDLGMLTDKRRIYDTLLISLCVWVKKPAIVFGKEREVDAIKFIKKLKGLKFIQCITDPNVKYGLIRGTAAPACTLKINWGSFDEYLRSLRSGYRYRYNKALKKSEKLTVSELTDNKNFSHQMYSLYEQVEQTAKIKIDKLPIEFFRGEFFKILVFKENNTPVGFVQLLENGEELIFEFVGFDYAANAQYDTYHRMLLEIIRYGINGGFKYIDFGQTADEAKLKLGCYYEYLNVYVHHRNPFIHLLYRLAAPFIDYKPMKQNFNVFREEGENKNENTVD